MNITLGLDELATTIDEAIVKEVAPLLARIAKLEAEVQRLREPLPELAKFGHPARPRAVGA